MTKLDDQLYPVITTNSTNPQEISTHLNSKLERVLPDIKKAQNEVEQRIKTAEALISKAQATDEKALNVRNKLSELNQKLSDITAEYQLLLEALISYFNNLVELDETAAKFNKIGDYPTNVAGIETTIREHEVSKQAVLEMFKRSQNECEKVIQRIIKQVPFQQ